MNAATMSPVSSSVASHIGYDPRSKVLRVTFKSGKTYRYPGVAPHEHAALLKAPSIGKHLNQHFRDKGEPVE